MRCLGSPDPLSDSSPPPPQQRGSELELELPPGFRFHPTDEELLVHYLRKKAAKVPLPVTIIAEVDLYKFDPWELPEKATFGEQEWYFFSPRDRKYPNGARPNRAATSGYWKATGTDKPILASAGSGREKVGVRKALVFYCGKPPKGLKTNWIMHEYRLTDGSTSSSTTATRRRPVTGGSRAAASLRLDDWVLCRIYEKINKAASPDPQQRRGIECQDFAEDAVVPYPPYATDGMAGGSNYGSQLHHLGSHEDSFQLDGLLTAEYAGISAGATSLSHIMGAPARASPAATKQLLPPSSPTLFNWLNESTVRILPPADMAGVADNPVNTMSAFILGTALPPEASGAAASAFQHPVQISGVNWNP